MKKIKLINFLPLIILAIIVLIAFQVYNGFNKPIVISENKEDRKTAFGSYILDSNNERLLHSIKLKDPIYDGKLAVGGYFQKETCFYVTLLNNFKQVQFSIDGSSKSKVHEINFIKNENMSFVFYKHSINIDNLEKGLNDLLLVFTQKYDDNDLDYFTNIEGTHRATYLTRFSILCGEDKIQHTEAVYDIAQKTLGNINFALQDIFIYDMEFNKFERTNCPYNTLNYIHTKGSLINFPLSVNTRTQVEGTSYYNKYLEDEKMNKSEQIAVFSLLDGQLVPAYYNKNQRQSVAFYEKKLKDVIMLNPKINITRKGLNRISIIEIGYPFTNIDSLSGTYKLTKWYSGSISNEVFIEK